ALLTDLQCRVVAVESGRSRVAALDRGADIDLAGVDFSMPGMNGIEMGPALLAQTPAPPLIMITGFPDIAPAGARYYALHVLKKPFQRAELAAMLLAAAGPGSINPRDSVQRRPAAEP